jgi:glycopeptide antibiotics resistance protein
LPHLPRFFAEFFRAVPWFLPGLVVWAALAALLRHRAARRLGIAPVHAFFVLVAFGIVFLATLTPTGQALGAVTTSTPACDLSRIAIAPLTELLRVNDTSRNVVLFVPLGVALGLAPVSRATTATIVLALVLPVVIESVQLVLPALGRGCQSADVIDNALGLTIGLALGTAGRLALARLSRS